MCLAVKKNNKIEPTTGFFSEKMLMLAKLSLMSFIYGDNRKCCFPNEKIKQMFEEYKVEKNLSTTSSQILIVPVYFSC